MSIARKKTRFTRLSFEKALLAETRALWMHVDMRRFVNGLFFGCLFGACIVSLNFHHSPPHTLREALGSALLIVVASTIYTLYLVTFEPGKINAFRSIAAVGALSIMPVAAAIWFPSFNVPIYLVPVTMVAFIFGIVYSERTAIVLSLMLCLLVGISLQTTGSAAGLSGPQSRPYDLMVILFGGAAVAALGCGRIRKRSKLLKVGFYSSVIQIILIVGAKLRANEMITFDDFVLGVFNGVGWAALVTSALPLVEQAFKVATGMRLLELSDQSHPLLRRLSLEAPGTYHHSLILGNLVESAGEAISANALLLRVGAYFHDVGKLMKPEYFVENESLQGSMHANLSPTMSALIITAHTKDGVELARENGLPEPIIDLIRQHHGTSLVEYFYHQAKDLQEDGKVDEELFRHPGPKPMTREAGVLLLVDSVESASRTLPSPTPSRIARQVHEIINRKMMDGQLDECELTLADVHKIEQNVIRSLTSVFHGRIKYPEPDAPLNGKEQNGR